MAHRSHVPEFGNWGAEAVPYTVFFDKARKGRNGAKMINPNDPEENPDILSDTPSSRGVPRSKPSSKPGKPMRQGMGEMTHERRQVKQDSGPRSFGDSPSHYENVGRKNPRISLHKDQGDHGVSSGEHIQRRAARTVHNGRSPLHAQAMASGIESPSWEGKRSYGSSHGTPGRFRTRPVVPGNETPGKGAAIPKFGEWDVADPASAEGFTDIFDKVRVEKREAGKVPDTSTPSYANLKKQDPDDNAKGCCFPWGR